MFLLVWGCPPLRRTRLWLWIGGLALLGVAALVGIDLQNFLAGDGNFADSPKRALFVLISSTDFPLMAAIVGTVVNTWACWRWQKARLNMGPKN